MRTAMTYLFTTQVLTWRAIRLFVNHIKDAKEGQAVEFDVVDGNKGTQAVHVKRV